MFGGQTTLPIVFMTQNGAGSSAGHHHSQPVHPFFMNMPLIKVVLPSTPYDVKGLLKSAIRDNNPVVFLNSLALGGKRGEVPDEEYVIPLGVADTKRAGKDVTICTAGAMVYKCLDAAEILAGESTAHHENDPTELQHRDRGEVAGQGRQTSHTPAGQSDV